MNKHLSVRELRPCHFCKGPIRPSFVKLTVQVGVVNERAIQQFAGMYQFFGGQSVALAELFTPSGDEAAVLQEKKTSLLVCMVCATERELLVEEPKK